MCFDEIFWLYSFPVKEERRRVIWIIIRNPDQRIACWGCVSFGEIVSWIAFGTRFMCLTAANIPNPIIRMT